MKMRTEHLVPLATQALDVLKELSRLTGDGKYFFPCNRTTTRAMSENTVTAAIRRLGYTGDQMTGHGFRAMASTRLNEMGYPVDVIERQLAHAQRNKVRAAYNRAEYLAERREMTQQWADYLEGLRDMGTLGKSDEERLAELARFIELEQLVECTVDEFLLFLEQPGTGHIPTDIERDLKAIKEFTTKSIWPNIDSWNYGLRRQILVFGLLENLFKYNYGTNSYYFESNNLSALFAMKYEGINGFMRENEVYCDEDKNEDPKEFIQWARSKELHIPSHVVEGLGNFIDYKVEYEKQAEKNQRIGGGARILP